MKKNLFLLVYYFLILGYSAGQTPSWLWAKRIGGTSSDGVWAFALDNSGNVYVTGAFYLTVDFDPGPGVFNLTSAGYYDMFILKLDSAGNFIWAKRIGGYGDTFGTAIAMDASNNIYLTGNFRGGTTDFDPDTGTYNLTPFGYDDTFICKLDSAGNFIWAKQIGGTLSHDYGWSIAIDALDNVYVDGNFWGTVDFDPGPGTFSLTSSNYGSFFLSKLNNLGDLIWAKAVGDTGGAYSKSIVLDSIGNIYCSGDFQGTVDFDPDTGIFNLTSTGLHDVFASKFDSSGNFVWAKELAGAEEQYASSITLSHTGNAEIIIIGNFGGTVDFDTGPGIFNLTSAGGMDIFISKFSNSGNLIWAKSVGGNSLDGRYSSVVLDQIDNVYITGDFRHTADFDPGAGQFNLTADSVDLFVSKLDSAGNFLWAKSAGGSSEDVGQCITITNTGYVYLTGGFLSPLLIIGNDSLVNANNSLNIPDIYIAKLDTALTTGNTLLNLINNLSSISPNPFTTTATISFGRQVSGATFSLYNLLGEKVAETSGINAERFEFSRAGLGSGVYVYEVREKVKSICRGKAVVY